MVYSTYIRGVIMIIKMGDRIKELRQIRNISQKELASALHVSRNAINAWEMNVSLPSSKRILEIAEYFNISIDYLFGINSDLTVNLSNLNEDSKTIILNLISMLKYQKKGK